MTALMLCNFNGGRICNAKFWTCAHFNKSMRNLYVSHSLDAKDAPDVKTILVEDDVSPEEEEQKVEQLRNKSKLKTNHRNELLGKKPFAEPLYEYHYSLKYNRKMLGKYGLESGVNPGISWPNKADLSNRLEYERVAYPHTIQELVDSAKRDIEMRESEIQSYHSKVLENLTKLDKWKKDLKERIAKKEAEAVATKQKKERLVEEVRRHFGFTVDVRDERFKEMLAVKEKEQKKKDKLAKMEEREKKAIAKLMSKHDTNVSDPSDSIKK